MTNNPLRSVANNPLLQPTLNQPAQSATVTTTNSVGTSVAVRQVSGDADNGSPTTPRTVQELLNPLTTPQNLYSQQLTDSQNLWTAATGVGAPLDLVAQTARQQNAGGASLPPERPSTLQRVSIRNLVDDPQSGGFRSPKRLKIYDSSWSNAEATVGEHWNNWTFELPSPIGGRNSVGAAQGEQERTRIDPSPGDSSYSALPPAACFLVNVIMSSMEGREKVAPSELTPNIEAALHHIVDNHNPSLEALADASGIRLADLRTSLAARQRQQHLPIARTEQEFAFGRRDPLIPQFGNDPAREGRDHGFVAPDLPPPFDDFNNSSHLSADAATGVDHPVASRTPAHPEPDPLPPAALHIANRAQQNLISGGTCTRTAVTADAVAAFDYLVSKGAANPMAVADAMGVDFTELNAFRAAHSVSQAQTSRDPAADAPSPFTGPATPESASSDPTRKPGWARMSLAAQLIAREKLSMIKGNTTYPKPRKGRRFLAKEVEAIVFLRESFEFSYEEIGKTFGSPGPTIRINFLKERGQPPTSSTWQVYSLESDPTEIREFGDLPEKAKAIVQEKLNVARGLAKPARKAVRSTDDDKAMKFIHHVYGLSQSAVGKLWSVTGATVFHALNREKTGSTDTGFPAEK